MPINSLNSLLKMFPYFFDKRETSNFYKSQKVTNNLFKKIYNDLKEVYESTKLDKKILIWKEQNEAYNYTMHFVSNFKLLKNVKVYCDDEVIYEAEYILSDDKSYSYLSRSIVHNYIPLEVQVPVETDDGEMGYETNIEIQHEIHPYQHTQDENIIIFEYSHNATSENIIPNEKYSVAVTTYDEYEFNKGFPENDTPLGNEYDHDISLDEIGAENNVPRRQYTTIIEEDFTENEILERYIKTDPPFNNQATEDDYHYMKRLITYLIKYHTTSLPVLEIWKLYGIDAILTNRDSQILRFFDEDIHPPNSEGNYDWIPQPWEHKDKWMIMPNVLGEYFFVSASTLQPVKKQNVDFTFKLVNSLYQTLDDEYYITITVNGVVMEEHYTDIPYQLNHTYLDESIENIIVFEAKRHDDSVIDTVTFFITVRGCNTADFYVNMNASSEIEDGTKTHPFKTLQKAMDKVNGVYDLIAVIGENIITEPVNVKESCTIIGCNNAKLIKNKGCYFFNIAQSQKLTIQDITFVTEETNTLVDNYVYINENQKNIVESVVTESVDYGVLLEDLNCTTFMKNIHLEGNKLVYNEINQNELEKLNDTNKLIQNLQLEGNKITYTEYTPITTEENNLELPYIHLDDRLELVNAVEKLELENNTLISTEYGDELAWEIKRHLISNQS